jgi:hypothetical protein
MLSHLHSTCIAKKIAQAEVDSCLKPHKRNRRIEWKAENFIHKNTGESHAILYWKKTPDEGEEWKVIQFTGPDGSFYVADSVQRPSSVTLFP